MKVAFFSNNYRPFMGGVTRSIDTFRPEFEARGHAVHLFVPRFKGYEEREERVYRVPSIPKFNHTDFSLPLPFSLKVRNIFGKLDLDLVHAQHPFFLGEMGMHLGKSRNLPIVLTYHTQYDQYSHYTPIDSALVKRWIINVCTSFCNLCDLVVAPCSDIRELLLQRGVATRIEVIPTGIDLSAYGHPDRSWLRETFGLSRKQKILLHVGRLAKEKNLEFLLQAVAQAMARDRDLVLLVAGTGDRVPRLKELSQTLGLGSRVVFHGQMQPAELVNAYAGADLFVFTSKTETQGLVILESMAAGTPAVAVDAPGVRDTIQDGVNGYLTPEDVDVFSERILSLIGSPETRAAFSEAAQKTAAAYSASRMAERMLQEYAELLRRPPDTLNPEIHHFNILKGLLREAVRGAQA
jgi:glycosyltransferase involved in cell wall biosynthesis